MLNIFLPDSIYERLPWIYLSLALALSLTPLSSAKWLVVAALVVATLIVHRTRQSYREKERRRRVASRIERFESRRKATASRSDTVAL